MCVAGVFAWLQGVLEGERAGIAGKGDAHRDGKRRGSLGVSPILVGCGDMIALTCRLTSMGRATWLHWRIAWPRGVGRHRPRWSSPGIAREGDAGHEGCRLIPSGPATSIAMVVARDHEGRRRGPRRVSPIETRWSDMPREVKRRSSRTMATRVTIVVAERGGVRRQGTWIGMLGFREGWQHDAAARTAADACAT